MRILPKLQQGDTVAIVSPSFAAPGKWPQVYELGLKNVREVFGLEPTEFPTTKKIGASGEERGKDLVAAFDQAQVRAVIASLGGSDQVTYIKNLPPEPFANNPKPFFGFSDNTHFANFLWLQGIPSFYGGALFIQFAYQKVEAFTKKYLSYALFESGERELESSPVYSDIDLDWNDPENLGKERVYEPSDGWQWAGTESAEGISWGGCIESIDDILRHNIPIPSLEDFENIILFTESSEEIPTAEYVSRVYRALGERGILQRVRGIIVGRPKAWRFDNQKTSEEKRQYRAAQREAILQVVRQYNKTVTVVQDLDIGHTNPQIALPYGGRIRIDAKEKRIFADF